MTDFIANKKDFPLVTFFPEVSEKFRNKHNALIEQLLTTGTRPTPERIEALLEASNESFSRKLIDHVFSISESVPLPETPEDANFDTCYPRLKHSEILSTLSRNPENQRWLQGYFERVALRHNISVTKDIVTAGNQLLQFLSTEVSYWEADSFPLDAMTDLTNRYE